MNARITTTLPAFGELLEAQGGYLHGIYMLHNQLWGEVTAPKAVGELKDLVWTPKHTDLAGAQSAFDGLANTIAMANADSPLAQAAMACRHGGFEDWHVAARGGAFMQWANLQALLPEDEKLDDAWYATSTQNGRYGAWYQYFGNGNTDLDGKSWAGWRARLVRRFPIQ